MGRALADELRALADAEGLAAIGFATAEPFDPERAVIEDRKSRGLHAGMHFTYGRPDRSCDPARALPGAQTLIVVALSYLRRPPAPADGQVEGRVAAYQWDDHYGRLHRSLERLAGAVEATGHRALVLADDNRLVDRAAAHRAGLGWFGRNTNLLLPGQGSWFVLGSVLTDAALPVADAPVPDGCGPCRACVPACPTGALDVPGELDARRCLAWTVQAPGVFPRDQRVAVGDRLYGCDDCQTACPPNRVRLRREGGRLAEVPRSRALVDVLDLLDATDDEIMARHGHWYVPRRQPDYLRRNALVVLANVGSGADPDVERVLRTHLVGPALVAAHAVWAARRLDRDDLVGLADATDPLVAPELVGQVPARELR